ncbi:MAG TPA: FtsX-like permease family protein [Rhizomicrobium sp.]|nr:FtsX-like permease family protein [Rhizomicrobium sp.]
MIRQIFIVSALNFRNLRQRFWQSMVIVVGLAATVGVLLSMNSLSEGMLKGYLKAGDPGRAIVVSVGATSEPASHITRDMAKLISVAPGIAKDADGAPLADFGINATLPVVRNDGSSSNTTMRGVGPRALKIRPEIKIVSGRMFRSGQREMVVGISAQAQYRDMKIGDNVAMPDGAWPIVGAYTSGDVLEGQVLGDADTVMTATHKKNFNSVLVRLESYNSLSTLKNALTSNPALAVTAERHNDWYKRFSAGFSGFLTAIAYVIGGILAVGALFGCLNTMYAAVSTRGREIATLRALGFGAFPVAVSVMLEAILLSVAGALLGAAIAWLLFDGRQQPFGNNVYHLTISPAGIGLGVVWACVVALLGGLLPSIQAARRPVAEALRAT